MLQDLANQFDSLGCPILRDAIWGVNPEDLDQPKTP